MRKCVSKSKAKCLSKGEIIRYNKNIYEVLIVFIGNDIRARCIQIDVNDGIIVDYHGLIKTIVLRFNDEYEYLTWED